MVSMFKLNQRCPFRAEEVKVPLMCSLSKFGLGFLVAVLFTVVKRSTCGTSLARARQGKTKKVNGAVAYCGQQPGTYCCQLSQNPAGAPTS